MTDLTPQNPPSPLASSPATPPTSPRCWVLIPCAGSGSRAGSAGPKQYQPLVGQLLVAHTLAAFAATPGLAGVLVVVASGDNTLEQAGLAEGCHVADGGGASRAESVLNGLGVLSTLGAVADDWVLVHDAARCLITPTQVRALIEACWNDPVGGLLAQPLADTLKSGAAGPGGRHAGPAGQMAGADAADVPPGPVAAGAERQRTGRDG